MKIYLAGIFTSNFDKHGRMYALLDEAERYHRDRVPYFLESYHYIGRQSALDKIRRDNVQVFLDSGAYSAFTKGVEVDLKAYCRYILENDDIIVKDGGVRCASVLDSIGNPLQTWENQQAMERLGAAPLPCYHYGDDERYLEYYISHYEYITIGGMVPISNKQLEYWLDRIWATYLTDSSGTPRCKIHGFGLTSLQLIEDYPWHSVDSSAWVLRAANGIIMIPNVGAFFVSNNSPSRQNEGQHVNSMLPAYRDTIIQAVEGAGFSMERIQTLYASRWAFNCYNFNTVNEQLNQSINSMRFSTNQIRLF